jgi:phage shock protein PspC (stress-responsive transcriptional regulator)
MFSASRKVDDRRMETDTRTDQETDQPTDSLGGPETDWAPPPTLVRPHQGRMLAGVAAAAADYLGLDVTVVRILIVASCLIGGVGVPLYLAAWLLIPEEDADCSIAADLLHSHGSY